MTATNGVEFSGLIAPYYVSGYCRNDASASYSPFMISASIA